MRWDEGDTTRGRESTRARARDAFSARLCVVRVVTIVAKTAGTLTASSNHI